MKWGRRRGETSKSMLSRNTPQNEEPASSLLVSGGKRCSAVPGQEAPPRRSRAACLPGCLHSSVRSDYCAVSLKSTHHPSARVHPQVHNTHLISSWQRQQSSIHSDQTSIQGNFGLKDQRAEALASANPNQRSRKGGSQQDPPSTTLPGPTRSGPVGGGTSIAPV